MPRKIHEKFRARSGFTLSEVLVTLAILGVLLAVAIPATFALTKGLKMMELDACARQIAVAVQNNLTGMKSAGTLKSYGDKNTAPVGGHYISNSHADIQKILPNGAIDPAVAGKHYTIVYNSVTGTVLEVYYAEDWFDVSDALTNLSGMETANVEDRKTAKIGYYNGEDIKSGPINSLPIPVVTIENGMDLKVTVTATPINWSDKATLTLHVASAKKLSAVKEFTDVPVDALGKAYVTLDSLTESSQQFKKQFETSGIAPGDNLKIWATLDPKDPTKYLSATSNIEYTNSLFGSCDTAENTVTIENPRHLQNLHKAFSGLTLNDVRTNFSAVQTKSIDWTKAIPAPGGVQNFFPIKNEHLARYDGGTNPINGLKVAVNTSAGLFESLSGKPDNKIALTGIRLVNPSIIANGKDAGALVGTATNVTVKDCFAYASVPLQLALEVKVSGTTAGGLIGSATNCNISYSGAAMPTVTGTTAAGGLIGVANTTTTVTNSYADTDNLRVAHKDAYVAGFIGSADGKKVKVENCYAVGNCYALDDNGEKVNKASGFISGEKRRNDVAVSVKNSYCAMTYLDAKGEPLGLKDIGGFSRLYGTYTNCAYLTPVGATVSTELPDSKVPKTPYAELAQTPVTFSGDWTQYPMSHPYRDDLKDKTYPFPALKMEKVGTSAQAKMPHYGSWPAVPAPEGGGFLAYYEEYDAINGGKKTNGVYYLDEIEGKTQIVNTLDNKNEKNISNTKYGILLPKGQTPDKAEIFIGGEQIVLECEVETLPPTVEINGEKFSFYPFVEGMLGDINEEIEEMIEDEELKSNHSIPVEVNIGGVSVPYQINLNFAAGIAPADKPLGTKDWPLQVRTQEQLQAVDSVTVTDERCYFLQTHNIKIQNRWNAIKSFSENYDGGSNTITNTTCETNTATTPPAPIFRTIENGATVKNVAITKTKFNDNHTVLAENGFGFLARTNNGTVQDCTVEECKVSPGEYVERNIVGFIWENAGTIKDCTVDKLYIEAPYYGIFTGFVNTNRGTITGSQVKNAKIFGNIGTEKIGGSNAERQIAGFVNINEPKKDSQGKIVKGSGSITECSTSDVILSLTRDESSPVKVRATGFVAQNWGTIEKSHVYSSVASDGTIKIDTTNITPENVGTINRSLVYSKYEGAAGFVDNNDADATITGCSAVADVASTNGRAAGFVDNNDATITDCSAVADVASTNGRAAGFVDNNDAGATITGCSAVADVTSTDGRAAGFVDNNDAGATITGCSAVADVASTNGRAAGFVGTNSSTITLCSAVADVTSTNGRAAGFVARNSGNITESKVLPTKESDGTIKNRSLVYSKCEGAAGFVDNNDAGATITGCSAVADVQSDGTDPAAGLDYAAGFVAWNDGEIEGSNADCVVKGNKASGFARYNDNSITKCTAKGNISIGNGDAAGFIYENGHNSGAEGTITGCQVTDVKIVGNVTEMGKMAAGFATINNSGGTIENSLVTDVRIWMWDKTDPKFPTGDQDNSNTEGLGSAAGFVGTNHGTITDSHVRSTEASNGQNDINKKRSLIYSRKETASGFVYQNNATIENCSAVADVTKGGYRVPLRGTDFSDQHAVGFAYDNSGTIQKSYANCAVYGWTGASGFVYSNSGPIENCYAMGSATAANVETSASGFATKSTGTQLQNCYAAVELNRVYPGAVFGFAQKNGQKYKNCYYVPYGSANSGTDAAEKITYIKAINGTLLGNLNGGVWGNTETSYPYAPELQGKQIPFPTLKGNLHYGDWPQILTRNTGNAIGVFYYEKQADGRYLIDAAAISYTSTNNAIVISEESFIPNFLTGPFNVEKDSEWGTSGLGLCYSSNLAFTLDFLRLKYAVDSREYNKTSQFPYPDDATQKLGDSYYFKPISNLQMAGQKAPYVALWYYYANNSNRNWQYKFQYNRTDKDWTITEIKN